MRRLALVALVAAMPSLAAAAPASYVIQGDSKIGSYAVKRDGSFQGMMEAFGRPTSVRRDEEICRTRWAAIGLRVVFYNLGGANPCRPDAGRFSDAQMTSSRWRTSLGLRIGDPLGRLRALYRNETRHGAWWWLVTRRSPFGERGLYAGLSAKVVSGRVSAFSVVYPAGGD